MSSTKVFGTPSGRDFTKADVLKEDTAAFTAASASLAAAAVICSAVLLSERRAAILSLLSASSSSSLSLVEAFRSDFKSSLIFL